MKSAVPSHKNISVHGILTAVKPSRSIAALSIANYKVKGKVKAAYESSGAPGRRLSPVSVA